MKTNGVPPPAAESLYVEVELKGSRSSRAFWWPIRILGAVLEGVNVEPPAVLRIRSRFDDMVIYEEKYRFGLPEAKAAKERFENELRTMTMEQFKDRYVAT